MPAAPRRDAAIRRTLGKQVLVDPADDRERLGFIIFYTVDEEIDVRSRYRHVPDGVDDILRWRVIAALRSDFAVFRWRSRHKRGVRKLAAVDGRRTASVRRRFLVWKASNAEAATPSSTQKATSHLSRGVPFILRGRAFRCVGLD